MDVESVAMEGREKAVIALEKIESHEKLCSERYEGINEKLKSIADSLIAHQTMERSEWSKLYGRMWKVTGVIMLLLIGSMGTFGGYIFLNI